MTRRASKAARVLTPVVIALTSTALLAQYALDSNLRVGGRRVGGRNVNSARASLPMQHDVYRVNRRTGAMVYDENAAFAQPRYQPGNPARRTASPQQYSYHRPIQTTGPDHGIYTVDRRTGTFRRNEANALGAQSYKVYQSAMPRRDVNDTLEIARAKPAHRSAARHRTSRRGMVSTPLVDPIHHPQTTPHHPRTAPHTGAGAKATPVARPEARPGNLRPNRYRPTSSDPRKRG